MLWPSLAAITCLLSVAAGSRQNEHLKQHMTARNRGGLKALFSFTSPGSLFPPSAIISLTDDNSTFFLARPAAFGPSLPQSGLSSPLWIGSGFGDDALGPGELGCSDSSDWNDHDDLKDASTSTKPHADIQSLQEAAEIQGKVALLKRGGCGFLAKVQWAQNRGAVAVIVGDHVRGGALIRMYAKGDTSNITIPSLFTSHTTAHLLSSLLPSKGDGSGSNLVHPSNVAEPNHDKQHSSDSTDGHNIHGELDSTILSPSSRFTPRADFRVPSDQQNNHMSAITVANTKSKAWPHSIFNKLGLGYRDSGNLKASSRRPPMSGSLGWRQEADWSNDQVASRTGLRALEPIASQLVSDNLVIGKHDCRDQALPSTPLSISSIPSITSPALATTQTTNSVLPGSGEYVQLTATVDQRKSQCNRWFSPKLDRLVRIRSATVPSQSNQVNADPQRLGNTAEHSSAPKRHEGLWVTLTPTNVSSSPFFDTLLVLVVSPLVTLTVVYALLLLRSRIRRRRWRAPKSLVERLPVRTYQTISDSPPSATPSSSSPTTPLLQHPLPRPISPIDEVPVQIACETPSTSSSIHHHRYRTREEEKRDNGLAEWRRRYGGRQKECVVCLEEYVNGVSQVMSLPCGHEFHADCM